MKKSKKKLDAIELLDVWGGMGRGRAQQQQQQQQESTPAAAVHLGKRNKFCSEVECATDVLITCILNR
jgi:membrane protease subunit (stomatin/prohibitin family)